MTSIHNPATGELLREVTDTQVDQIDAVMGKAREAFRSWGALPGSVRSDYLFKLASELESKTEEIARIEAQTGLTVLNLPKEETFHVGLHFPV